MKKIFTLIFAFILSDCFSQSVFYISDRGNDRSNGLSQNTPWKTLKSFTPGNTYLFQRGNTFYFPIPRIENPGLAPTKIGAYGEGEEPVISLYTSVSPAAWRSGGTNIWKVNLNTTKNFSGYKSANSNIGFLNIGGTIYGNKLPALNQLSNQWDYYSDAMYLYVYSNTAPPSDFKFTSYGHVINLSNALEIDGIKVTGSGSHGIAGYTLKNVVIRNVIVTEIGGSYLPGFEDGSVRYGNGIEFWSGSDNCIVENCHVSQVYDVAFTMQGLGAAAHFVNSVFRNNIADRNEQSFEYWARDAAPGFTNCQITGNTCTNAGYGWSHAVRPWKDSGVHLLSYKWDVTFSDLTIENNTFNKAISGLYFHPNNERFPDFTSRNNIIYLDPLVRIRSIYDENPQTVADASEFVEATGKEIGSVFNYTTSETLSETSVSITAVQETENTVKISWQSEEESGNQRYALQRSLVDTSSFENITTSFFTKKKHQINKYEHIDENAFKVPVYYRVKFYDKDSKVTYSKVIQVTVDKPNEESRFDLFPLPGQLQINAITQNAVTGTLSLYSLSGHKLLTETLSFNKGNSVSRVNTPALRPGMYIWQMKLGEKELKVKKLLIK